MICGYACVDSDSCDVFGFRRGRRRVQASWTWDGSNKCIISRRGLELDQETYEVFVAPLSVTFTTDMVSTDGPMDDCV